VTRCAVNAVHLSQIATHLSGWDRIVFVELDRREDARYTVALEWDRQTGDTQIIVADSQAPELVMFRVTGEDAGDAFRHPFRYAP
jgi:hypothetical protein